jgi:hypothetical protein
VPVAVPVLKEYPAELIVHAAIGGAEIHRHIYGRLRVNVEAVYVASLDADLSVLRVYLLVLVVDFDAHDARRDAEILGLELVEVQQRALRPHRGVNQPTQILWDGSLEILFVCLPEEKTSAWGWLEKLGRQETTKPKERGVNI